ncbi:hypothetical protein QYF36_003025 [Acer negundo]|nr:hypothetical protein QYF36_003025 [Acer negundo]
MRLIQTGLKVKTKKLNKECCLFTGMFSEVELLRDVAVLAENLDRNGLVSQRFIMTRLLEDLLKEKANKDLGYFLAVTSLKSIGNGKLQDESGNVFFPVAFKCRTFMPLRGEVLEGVVHHIYRFGVFLQCGPVKYAFLSFRKMPNYSYVPGEHPTFVNDQLAKIENGVVVRFLVLGVRWIEKRGEIMKRDFVMLASLEGESLGPISLSGTDEMDFTAVALSQSHFLVRRSPGARITYKNVSQSPVALEYYHSR